MFGSDFVIYFPSSQDLDKFSSWLNFKYLFPDFFQKLFNFLLFFKRHQEEIYLSVCTLTFQKLLVAQKFMKYKYCIKYIENLNYQSSKYHKIQRVCALAYEILSYFYFLRIYCSSKIQSYSFITINIPAIISLSI